MSYLGKVFKNLINKVQFFQRFKNFQFFRVFVLRKIFNQLQSFFIGLFHSQKSYKTIKYIYAYTLTHARVHICIIVYISTAILRENSAFRRLRVLSSSPELFYSRLFFETVDYIFLFKRASLIITFWRFQRFRQIDLASFQ